MGSLIARLAVEGDIPDILAIYNRGIDERIATFETDHRNESDIEKWFDGIHPVCVCEQDNAIIAFAASFPYSSRTCYSGVAEFSVYVSGEYRGRGAGKTVMNYLTEMCRSAGIWKLVSRIFPENIPSRALMKSLGFREVGIYEKHARLDGLWKDTVIVELLIQET